MTPRTLIVVLTLLLALPGRCKLMAQTQCATLTQVINKYYKAGDTRLSILAKQLRIKKLGYQNSLSEYNIRSKVDFSLPYSKSIESVLQPDGNSIYIERNYFSPTYSITTSKKIPLTGGTIGLTTGLSYFKNFLNTNQQFNANWYNLYISQPFFAFNEYKFDKKLRRLTLSADSIQYYKDREAKLEELMAKIIDFEVLRLDIAYNEQEIGNNRDALEKVKILYAHGKLLSIDTLTLSNNLKQSYLQKEQLESTMGIRKADLDFSFREDYRFTICDIEDLAPFHLDTSLLHERYARYNNQQELLINTFVSSEQIKRARKGNGITTTISAGNGINQSSSVFTALYNNPSQQQNVALAVSVPFTGWQSYKRNKEIAELAYQAVQMTRTELEQVAKTWVQEQLTRYSFLYKSYWFSKEKLIALQEVKRVQLEKVLSGRVSTNEYNNAVLSIDMAKMEQLNIIKQILLFRFELRTKTLYDFELMEPVF